MNSIIDHFIEGWIRKKIAEEFRAHLGGPDHYPVERDIWMDAISRLHVQEAGQNGLKDPWQKLIGLIDGAQIKLPKTDLEAYALALFEMGRALREQQTSYVLIEKEHVWSLLGGARILNRVIAHYQDLPQGMLAQNNVHYLFPADQESRKRIAKVRQLFQDEVKDFKDHGIYDDCSALQHFKNIIMNYFGARPYIAIEREARRDEAKRMEAEAARETEPLALENR